VSAKAKVRITIGLKPLEKTPIRSPEGHGQITKEKGEKRRKRKFGKPFRGGRKRIRGRPHIKKRRPDHIIEKGCNQQVGKENVYQKSPLNHRKSST